MPENAFSSSESDFSLMQWGQSYLYSRMDRNSAEDLLAQWELKLNDCAERVDIEQFNAYAKRMLQNLFNTYLRQKIRKEKTEIPMGPELEVYSEEIAPVENGVVTNLDKQAARIIAEDALGLINHVCPERMTVLCAVIKARDQLGRTAGCFDDAAEQLGIQSMDVKRCFHQTVIFIHDAMCIDFSLNPLVTTAFEILGIDTSGEPKRIKRPSCSMGVNGKMCSGLDRCSQLATLYKANH